MSAIGAVSIIQPSYQVAGYKVNQTQHSDFAVLFGQNSKNIHEDLPVDAKAVYMNVVEMRTNAKLISTGGDSNRIPSGDIAVNMIQTPTISIRTNQEYNRYTIQAYQARQIDYLSLAQSVARQSINQVYATLALTGSGGAYEGVLNAAGKITQSALLTTDSFGETLLDAQDPVELKNQFVSFFNYQLSVLNLVGASVHFGILTSQRVLQTLQTKVIPVLQSGGGMSWSILKTIEELYPNCTFEWGKDDFRFKGKGATSSKYDKMVISIATMPENKSGLGNVSTNFAAETLGQKIGENVIMRTSNIVPFEIPTVIENNGIRTLYEVGATTSGWTLQSNTVQVIADIRFEA